MKHAHSHHYQFVQRLEGDSTLLCCNRMSRDNLDCQRDIPVRKSCNFAVRIDPEGDKWFLRHIEGRSEHNHAPNVHPEAFLENALFEKHTRDETDFENLLKCPFVRIRKHDNDTFFAHTDGYRLWKTYPEVMLVEDIAQGVIMFRGIDCHGQTFPVAACIVDDDPNWNWIFTQLKELLDDYNIAHPGFFQIDIDETCVKQCFKVFRKAHEYLDPDAGETMAEEEIQEFMQRGQGAALGLWEEVVNAENEIEVDRLMSKMSYSYKGEKTQAFLDHMENKLYMVSIAEKNMSFHFGVRECAHYKRSWGVDDVEGVEEQVKLLLRAFVEIYEARSRENGHQLVSTKPDYSDFYKDVLHIVSYEMMETARNFDKQIIKAGGNAGSCWDCINEEALGYPCMHVLGSIKKERNLSPDDFHPHWRNMYADLSTVAISGKGRYAKEWNKLKAEFTEEERPAKRVCL